MSTRSRDVLAPATSIPRTAPEKSRRNGQKAAGAAHGSTALSNPTAILAQEGQSPQTTSFDPNAFLSTLTSGKSSQEYPPKESIFSQGDTADAVFYIQDGKVQLTVVSKRGKEAVIAILQEGSFFGEGCLAGQPLRMSTAKAVHRADVLRVTKEAMVRLLHQEPEFAERFVALYLVSQYPYRRRPGRPTLQFQ